MNIGNPLLQRIKESVIATAPEAKLVLFGSYARKQNAEGSDIDLLILVNQDKITWQEEKQITYPIYDLEFETGIQISLLVLSKKDWESKHKITTFYENVMRDGIVL
jgi:uncharacterized protein